MDTAKGFLFLLALFAALFLAAWLWERLVASPARKARAEAELEAAREREAFDASPEGQQQRDKAIARAAAEETAKRNALYTCQKCGATLRHDEATFSFGIWCQSCYLDGR